MGLNITGLRMVVLTVDESQMGMVGLMELKNADPPLDAAAWGDRVKTGETILVVPTDHMRALHQRMLAEGYTVVTPPTRMEVPNRPEIHEMMARDPDGTIINLTHRGPLD